MNFTDFSFGKDDVDRRLDKIIRRFMPDRTLSEVYGFIRKNLVRINGKKTKENYRINQNDILNIASFLLEKDKSPENRNSNENTENNLNIDKLIVFQNDHLLILNKPYDIKVHGDEKSLDQAVKMWYEKNITNNSLSFRPGPLHRLDRKTTGLLAFSLSMEGAKWFTENIENHTIRKTYLGISSGHIENSQKWVDKLSKTEDSGGFVTVQKDETKGKTAVTTATPLKYSNYDNKKEITLTKFEIETGRTHQIRAQSSIHRFPLLGDTAYGAEPLKNAGRDFFLHAWCLEFPENNPLKLPKILICEPDSDFLFV